MNYSQTKRIEMITVDDNDDERYLTGDLSTAIYYIKYVHWYKSCLYTISDVKTVCATVWQ